MSKPAKGAEASFAFDAESVGTDGVLVHHGFQIRLGKLNKHQVKRYGDAMRAGQSFPPIKAMRVRGALVLIDGFHRLAAAKLWGLQRDLEVEVVGDGTEAEARWLGFEANQRHGLPLKTSEVREGFKAYVKSKRNRHLDGRLKSYREMGKDLGVGHTTVRHWTERFFPTLFNRMSAPSDGPFEPGKGGGLFPTCDEVPMSALEFLDQARTIAAMQADDAEQNGELLARLESFLYEIRQRPAAAREF